MKPELALAIVVELLRKTSVGVAEQYAAQQALEALDLLVKAHNEPR